MSAAKPPRERKPAVFRPDDPRLSAEAPDPFAAAEPLPSSPEDDTHVLPDGEPAPSQMEDFSRRGRKWGWGALLLSAVLGLTALALGEWWARFVAHLFAREDWLGWLATGLLGLAILAAVMLAVREYLALSRLSRLGQLRKAAEMALDATTREAADGVVHKLIGLYAHRRDLAWGRARLKEHAEDIMSPREWLILAERELLIPLDRQACRLIAGAARRVSVVTAISPLALVDMAFVATENLRLLRRLAVLYGGRPGNLGVMRLMRMVVTHIAVTGGIAVGDDFLQQIIGHKITAKLSSRLGEGVLNGALTVRIGLAALTILRPLPHLATQPPRMSQILKDVVKGGATGGEKQERDKRR